MSGLMPPGPLSYEGQVVTSYITRPFSPTTANYQFTVPTIWVNTASPEAFILVAKPHNVADWQPIGAGFIRTLTGNTGGAVLPTAGNINIVGDGTTITVSGNPGTSTLTISTTGAVDLGLIPDTSSPPGTSPVTPNMGNITVTAGVVTAASDPIFTHSGAANTIGTYIQLTQAVASTDPTKVGIGAFNNAQFSVDPNGFVSLSGGSGGAIQGIIPQTYSAPGTSPVVPLSGNITLNSAVTAAGSVPTNIASNAANTVTVQMQTSQAIASADATKIGLAAFKSTQFAVDPNGFVTLNGSGVGETITGNSGGALSPTAGNWNIVGTGSITASGAVSTLTVQLTGLTNHAIQIGAGTATLTQLGPGTTGQVLQTNTTADPTWSTATYPSTTTINQLLFSSANNTVTGLATANNGVLTTGATGTPVITSLATNGQLIIGSSSGAPAAATLTAGTGITITNGANSITIAANGGVVGETITGNSGGALSPTAGNWNIVGTGSLTTSGSGSTLTAQLTGLTNHAIQIGAGTATLTQLGAGTTGQVLQTNTGADPTWSTATYPSTTTINQLLFSSANNTVSGLTTANNGVLTTGTSGTPVVTALSANGQLIIGSGSGAPAAATLTAGAGIAITNAANSITITATGGSFTWVDVTGATQAMAVETGYITDHTNVTYTLPATANLGDQIRVVGKLGITTIAQNANQQILMSSASSTVGVGGSVAGTNVGDCIWLVCITAGASTVWRAQDFVGNWTVT